MIDKTGSVSKSKIRKEILRKLKKQRACDRIKKSELIKEELFSLSEFKTAKCVMFYVSTNYEVDTHTMIDEAISLGKKVAVPVTLPKEKRLMPSFLSDPTRELTAGPYGIAEPKSSCIREVSIEEIDLVVVPGLAFDKGGGRIGHGPGYYDRFLKKLPSEVPRIGLAFDFQILGEIPSFPHDVPVNKLIAA